jgi:hypothetical protein
VSGWYSDAVQQASDAIAHISEGEFKGVRLREKARSIVATAGDRALDHGTTIEFEIDRAVQRWWQTLSASRRRRAAHIAKHSPGFIEAESDLKVVERRLVKVLNDTHGVEIDDDWREILSGSVKRFRLLLKDVDRVLDGWSAP